MVAQRKLPEQSLISDPSSGLLVTFFTNEYFLMVDQRQLPEQSLISDPTFGLLIIESIL